MNMKRLLAGCGAGLICMAGCAEPPVVRTHADLVRNLGHKVAVLGTYGVDKTGEHVQAEEIDVAVEVPPDLFGFGQVPIATGSPVRAVGIIARGAMSLGVFQDEETLARSRGRDEHPTASGFVLRDASVKIVDPATTRPVSP